LIWQIFSGGKESAQTAMVALAGIVSAAFCALVITDESWRTVLSVMVFFCISCCACIIFESRRTVYYFIVLSSGLLYLAGVGQFLWESHLKTPGLSVLLFFILCICLYCVCAHTPDKKAGLFQECFMFPAIFVLPVVIGTVFGGWFAAIIVTVFGVNGVVQLYENVEKHQRSEALGNLFGLSVILVVLYNYITSPS